MFCKSLAKIVRPAAGLVRQGAIARPLLRPLLNSQLRNISSSFIARVPEVQEAEAEAAKETTSANSGKTLEEEPSKEIPDLTPLKFEQKIYATIDIHNRPYLITEGDEIVLPFRMKHADVGDVLQFTDITTVGSRNFTYHLKKGIDLAVASIKGVVVEKTKSPMYVKEITKRRNRHVRHVQVKHDLTKIRITELKLNV
ncbi:DEKNAAC100111 [Brettanomyces naardenensis]|uniref:Large ribosomal subunit protein bL21m n=1 Tax=Brettanomyces naardenensis TaxID=13370 RepID=A0A448YF90_BRENA|nr:DEKNAAC100111 [Brettanomyces naardenensis]